LVAPGRDGAVRVQVQGELDLSTSPRLDQVLHHEIGAGRRVVLDLSEVAFIDSTGLNTLIAALRASDSNSGGLMLSPSLPAQVRRVLDITGLDKVIPIGTEKDGSGAGIQEHPAVASDTSSAK
jgi:anti-anti-sigma factor